MNNTEKFMQILSDIKDTDFSETQLYTYSDVEQVRKNTRKASHVIMFVTFTIGIAAGLALSTFIK